MKIAVFGCLHGMLNEMYKTVLDHERQTRSTIDFILVCGDCQTLRHYDDLACLAVPNKYKQLGDFHEYYAGKKQVPKLTIFVGGNHEASNYLMTLPYGGWVCENFYYLGYAGVVNYKGLRIAGISGIYNVRNSNRGRFERMPLNDQSLRSVYHTRAMDVFRLSLLSRGIEREKSMDVFLSHDWPARIYDHGDLQQLLRFKPMFRRDVESRDGLGNPLTTPLVHLLQPRRWFAAHLHCRFYANVEHKQSCRTTGFLSLNKIEKGRRFVEFIEMIPDRSSSSAKNDDNSNGLSKNEASQDELPKVAGEKTIDNEHEANDDDNLYYDLEWLSILRKTIELENSSWQNSDCPDIENDRGYDLTEEDIKKTAELMDQTGGLIIKPDFQMSEPAVNYPKLFGFLLFVMLVLRLSRALGHRANFILKGHVTYPAGLHILVGL